MSSNPFRISLLQFKRSSVPGYREPNLAPGEPFFNEADEVLCIGLEDGTQFQASIHVTRTSLGLSLVDNTSDLDKPLSTAAIQALALKVGTALLGVPGGVATLGPDGRISAGQTQLSEIYAGTWNASTNTPALSDGAVPQAGVYYVVETAGTTPLGGISSWAKGDRIQSNGTVWTKIAGIAITAATTAVSPPAGQTYTNVQDAIGSLQGQVSGKFASSGGTISGTLSVTGFSFFQSAAVFSAGATVNGGNLVVGANGAEGGQIELMRGTGASSLNGDRVMIDQIGNQVRIFESGAPNRGAYLDLAECGAQSKLWHASNFNPAAKADLSGAAFSGDLTTYRAASTNVGVIFFGLSGQRYLQFDGSVYQMPGAQLNVNGQRVWTAGDFNPANFALKTGQNFSGDIEIAKAYPGLTLHYPDLKRASWQIREDGRLYYIDQGGTPHFSIGGDGSITTQQLGDLNSRIESRASAYANAVAANVRSRLVYAGDKGANDPNAQSVFWEPFAGGVITGFFAGIAGGVQVVAGVRCRYQQASDQAGNWYTVPYV